MTDLRQRLQARRERIAAGLPPPVATTVTEKFFTSQLAKPDMRTCSECDVEFVPRDGRQITCSKSCYGRRESRLRAVEPYELVCKVCSAPFTSSRPQSVACSDACRDEWERRYKREWRRKNTSKGRQEREPRQCAADGCIQVFTPVRPHQATCGSKRCQREYRLARKRMHNAAYVAKQRRVERERREGEVTA